MLSTQHDSYCCGADVILPCEKDTNNNEKEFFLDDDDRSTDTYTLDEQFKLGISSISYL